MYCNFFFLYLQTERLQEALSELNSELQAIQNREDSLTHDVSFFVFMIADNRIVANYSKFAVIIKN